MSSLFPVFSVASSVIWTNFRSEIATARALALAALNALRRSRRVPKASGSFVDGLTKIRSKNQAAKRFIHWRKRRNAKPRV